MINGLFDLHFRLEKIDKNGDPLVQLNRLVEWERFRAPIDAMREKARKSNAGRKPWDAVLMVKAVILQSLYNLSDAQMERQILDRLSFIRFLGLALGDDAPDEKTIWLFKEQIAAAGLAEELFRQFDAFLRAHGFQARSGQIVDASIVAVPKQRNTREENRKIKAGEADKIEGWSEEKRRQKDPDARWTKKHGKTFFGYKNHVQVDVKHKFVRAYAVTDAAVHDSRVFTELLDGENTSRAVWADTAYRSAETLDKLAAFGFREHLQRKGNRRRKLPEREQRGNHTRAKVRSRVEHVFGVQAQKMGNRILRCIGEVRARCRIGLRNLAYNLDRYALLAGRA